MFLWWLLGCTQKGFCTQCMVLSGVSYTVVLTKKWKKKWNLRYSPAEALLGLGMYNSPKSDLGKMDLFRYLWYENSG